MSDPEFNLPCTPMQAFRAAPYGSRGKRAHLWKLFAGDKKEESFRTALLTDLWKLLAEWEEGPYNPEHELLLADILWIWQHLPSPSRTDRDYLIDYAAAMLRACGSRRMQELPLEDLLETIWWAWGLSR